MRKPRTRRRKKLRQIAALAVCQITRPDSGYTCLEQIVNATANPRQYGAEFRKRIMRGENCCVMCRIKAIALSGIGELK